MDDLYNLTPREFGNIVKGKAQREEQLQRTEWERARFISFHIARTVSNVKRVEDIIKFDWDNNVEDTSWYHRLKKLEEKYNNGRKS